MNQNSKSQSFGNTFRFDKAQELRLDFSDSDDESPQIPERGSEEEESRASNSSSNNGGLLDGNTIIRNTQTPGTSLSGNKFRFGVAIDSAKNAFEYRPAGTTKSTGEAINFKGGPMSTNSAASRAFKKSKMLKHINQMGEQHLPPIPSPSALSGGVAGFDQATLLLTDLDFFEQELVQHQNGIAETLADKRLAQGLMNEDPMEELTEVYSEVQVIE
jgi:hypothetical protein